MITRWITQFCGALLLLTLTSGAALAARSWSYSYHPDTTGPYGTIPGQLASVDGPRTDVADITSYAYDAQGNLIRTTNALGHISEITAHDAAGRPLTLVDPNGVVTTLAYDAHGRLTSRTTAGATTTFGYDGVGNLTALTLPTGVTLTYHYDAARRLTALEDSLGNRTEYVLDAAGNRTEERLRDAAGQLRYAKQQLYDELSRLRQVVGLDGSQQRHYDVNGNLIEEVDGEANATAHAFDALNRLTQTTDALAGQTVYRYDAQNHLTEVVDPKGNATEYVYNGYGDLIQVISPDTGTTYFDYDAAGNRIRQTDAKGQVTEYRYDALNRLTQIIDASQTVSFSYDDPNAGYGIGRLTGISGPGTQIQYRYTARGLRASETHQVGSASYTLHYGYDAADQLTSLTYPSGRVVHYQRDASGRIIQISTTHGGQSEPLASAIDYAPFGPLTSLTYGNGLHLTNTLDSHYRLTQTQVSAALNRAYRFNGNDDIIEIDRGQGASTYRYDALRRLVAAHEPSLDWLWSYDANSNRLSEQRDLQLDLYNVDSGSNRLHGLSGASHDSYTYDANGNVLTKGGLSFQYDAHNRLIHVSGAASAHYGYNAFHQRTVKTSGGQTTHYLYDPAGQLLAEFDGATGQALVEYVWLEGLPLAVIHSGGATAGTYFVHTDHLHTPQMLTDAQGSVVWQAEYTSFGRATVTTSVVPFQLRFPGQYFDQETGLHYNWHRYYDPQTGRYLSSDPIGLAGGLNTYEYGRSNPLRFVDPTGENALLLGLAAAAAGAGYWYWDFIECVKSCEEKNESCESDMGDTKPNLDCRRMCFLERLPVKPYPGPRSGI